MIRKHLLIIILLFFNLSFIGQAKVKRNEDGFGKSDCYIYVSVNKEKKIVAFKLDTEKGRLIPAGEISLTGEPGTLCLDPSNKKIYAGLRDIKKVAALNIDKKTGRLGHLKDTPVADNPVYISTDKRGKYLFCTSYSGNKSAVYPLESDGVNSTPLQIIDAPLNPHMIKTDASGKFVFVPNKGADIVQQFILQKDGTLKPNNPGSVGFRGNSGPRHFTFDPKGEIMYVVNELACTVTAFHYHKKSGTITGPFQEITTKPSDHTLYNTCADIHITPDGKFLYASNRGHDSLAGFSVDKKTGELSPIGWFATEKEPREFEIDPSGKFVIAAGESSGKIALYSIQKDGSLLLSQTCEVGHWPVWVQAILLKMEFAVKSGKF